MVKYLDDEIVITYNFTDNPEHSKLTKEHVTKTEKEIETAYKTVVSSNTGSYKLCHFVQIMPHGTKKTRPEPKSLGRIILSL